jgi:hypothetical protein
LEDSLIIPQKEVDLKSHWKEDVAADGLISYISRLFFENPVNPAYISLSVFLFSCHFSCIYS